MKVEDQHQIWTIGHSTHPLEEFLAWLQSFAIVQLVDVRSLPGSRKFPQFNQEALTESLSGAGIGYTHLKALGGRRKFHRDSQHTVWRNHSFRAYADYMQTTAFQEGLVRLKKIARKESTVIMCSEAVWWRCHRAMVADILKVQGWGVYHIMGVKRSVEHPFTQPAQIVDGHLYYGAAKED